MSAFSRGRDACPKASNSENRPGTLRHGALYHQLYVTLRQAIVQGQFSPGSALPGENVLAQRHGMSRVTVRRALDRLAHEGLVRRIQGAGTFVADGIQPVAITADITDHFNHVAWLADNTEVRLLSQETLPAPANVSEAMELTPGTIVHRIQRVRIYRGTPFLFLDTFVPNWAAERVDLRALESGSLHYALTEAGFVFGTAEHIATAVAADQPLASALQVAIAVPLLLTSWIERERDGRVLQYHLNYARPDLYVLRTRFTSGAHLRPPKETMPHGS